VAGLVLAAVGMRPGSPLVLLPERLAYLAQGPLAWSLGWGMWMVCAMALIAFLAGMARRLPEHTLLAHSALVLAIVGGAVDLLCDVINIIVLPALAARGPSWEPMFLTAEHTTFASGLIVANGLYSVSVALLTWCYQGRQGIKAPIVVLGYAVFGFGMLLAVAGFAGSPRLAELATGPTIGLFCVWSVSVARSLENADRVQGARSGAADCRQDGSSPHQ